MKKTIIETLIFFIILNGCGSISRSIDSLRIPDSSDIVSIIKSQSESFQEKFGLINIYQYDTDSMDLFIGIKESNHRNDFISRRNYRIVFKNDTIERIIGSYPKEYMNEKNIYNKK